MRLMHYKNGDTGSFKLYMYGYQNICSRTIHVFYIPYKFILSCLFNFIKLVV
ncbi:hypothetical protein RhiirB3_149253 [Rhizophagus irregularis]|nr:hypothetical protein RhiirB3_149253 [Rhizophagus irregularis]